MDNLFLTLIIFQSFIILLAFVSSYKPENKILIIYFSHIFLSTILYTVLEDSFGLGIPKNEWIRIFYEFIALCRPAIIVYFLYFLLDKEVPKIYNYLWLIPIVNLVADYTLSTLNPGLYQAGFYENWYFNFPFYSKMILAIVLFNLYSVFKKEIKLNRTYKTYQELLKMYWGKNILIFLLLFTISLLFYTSFTLMNGRLFELKSDVFQYTASYYNLIHDFFLTLFLFLFTYLLLRSSPVFGMEHSESSIEQKIIEIVLPSEEKTRNLQIELTDEQIQLYSQILDRLVNEEKIYLDPELSLNRLAEISGIKPRLLSQFIQFKFQKKYIDFINSYRVSEAKKILKEQNTTLYAVALDSGFNSESTFYKIFKDLTSLTPKQFREDVKNID